MLGIRLDIMTNASLELESLSFRTLCSGLRILMAKLCIG